jgi:hypothetical protein
MPDIIELSSFSTEMQKILDEYGEDVQIIADEEVVTVTKEAVKKLKTESPKNKGDYSKGWKMKKKDTRFGVETTIYNSTHGWLAHLLEHGHAKVNGGRTEAKPHVGPVQDWAEKEILKRLKEKL